KATAFNSAATRWRCDAACSRCQTRCGAQVPSVQRYADAPPTPAGAAISAPSRISRPLRCGARWSSNGVVQILLLRRTLDAQPSHPQVPVLRREVWVVGLAPRGFGAGSPSRVSDPPCLRFGWVMRTAHTFSALLALVSVGVFASPAL